MKSRLSSTIWTLVLVNGLVLFGVLWLAYNAGRLSNGASMLDFGSLPSGASGSVIFALFLVLGAIVFLAWRLNSSFVAPVQELAQFSERFATGDPRARAEVNSNDELGYIAENLNRAVARVSKATSNQEASDHLQRSITELLTVINQVARGDLTLRGKVTNDALGNVADAFNQMAAQLQASYTDLEAKVAARTHDLETANQHLALANQHLETANQHKSHFLATMSHELRTPLHAILGYTHLILDRIYGAIPPLVAEKLQRVQQSGQHLLTLINAVLDLARIESGRVVLSLTEYTMVEVVTTVVTTVEHLAAAKQLQLTVTLPTELPRGMGDAPRLTQVLLNLVSNAIAYTDVGEVGIVVSASDDRFTLLVRDTGPGIAAAEQARIFTAFEQGTQARTRPQQGTGLGLAIAKQIVELHGGDIGVRSCPGHGATFWCTIPIRVAAPEEET